METLLAYSSTKPGSHAAQLYLLAKKLACPMIGSIHEMDADCELAREFFELFNESPRIFGIYRARSLSNAHPYMVLAISPASSRFLSLAVNVKVRYGLLNDAESIHTTTPQRFAPLFVEHWGRSAWKKKSWKHWQMVSRTKLVIPTHWGSRMLPIKAARELYDCERMAVLVQNGAGLIKNLNPVDGFVAASAHHG